MFQGQASWSQSSNSADLIADEDSLVFIFVSSRVLVLLRYPNTIPSNSSLLSLVEQSKGLNGQDDADICHRPKLISLNKFKAGRGAGNTKL